MKWVLVKEHKSNDTLATVSTPSCPILISKYHYPPKGTGVLKEMINSRSKAEVQLVCVLVSKRLPGQQLVQDITDYKS